MSDITWENRDQAADASQAVEALADFFSSSVGIATAVGGDSWRVRSEKEDGSIDGAESYAKKWNVPFNRELTIRTIQKMHEKRYAEDSDGCMSEHIWVSSSEEC